MGSICSRSLKRLKYSVIPITIVVLIGLFVVQSRGSERIGAYFGPIMAVGFAVATAIFRARDVDMTDMAADLKE